LAVILCALGTPCWQADRVLGPEVSKLLAGRTFEDSTKDIPWLRA
jgi:hypothetical protein